MRKLLSDRIELYYITAICSLLIAVIGFTYNTWRLEVTEDNNNIRTASFEVLSLLSELEQNIYALHYDDNHEEGSPRIGWVKVGLIVDLSSLVAPEVEHESKALKVLWSEKWQSIEQDNEAVEKIVLQIDEVRADIKTALAKLQ